MGILHTQSSIDKLGNEEKQILPRHHPIHKKKIVTFEFIN